ncbi:MAG: ABC transporter ATP-binding protein [Sphingomonadales bacterium]|nr:ABC transporter ATP-binding protein [Sphingomonadales bacterium]
MARPPRLLAPADRAAGLRLALLMLASALTEGIGLVLLVPLLATLGQGSGGAIGTLAASIGLPLRLDLLLALFVAVVALRAVIVHVRTLAALRFEYAVLDRLRTRAWRALLHCDWRVLVGLQRSAASSLLITRIDQAGLYINQGAQALAAAVTLGGIGLAALAISPRMTLAALVAGAAVLLAFHGTRRRAALLGERLGEAYGGVHSQVGEGLDALRLHKGLGTEETAVAALAAQYAGLRHHLLAYYADLGRGQIALQAGGALVLAVLVWAALTLWRIEVALVLPMVALFARALPLLGAVQHGWATCAHSRPAVDEALALIARTEAAREEDAGSAAAPGLDRAITLDQVTVRFAASDRPALQAVSASIPARGITAIVGPSGAGKSTLADLVGGLLSPDGGTVRVDGVELAGPVRRAWRSRVAYVQQDPVLLAASLRDNLRWAAPQADDAALRDALQAASAGFALALPDGLDTRLGDGGRALSGGERQRLMLARALLRDPAVLILDEATSALDAENEAAIVTALRDLARRMAVVVIGHRGALPGIADHTIRLEQGRLV